MNKNYEKCTCAYCVGEATHVMKCCVMLRQKQSEKKIKENKRDYERVYKLDQILMEEET